MSATHKTMSERSDNSALVLLQLIRLGVILAIVAMVVINPREGLMATCVVIMLLFGWGLRFSRMVEPITLSTNLVDLSLGVVSSYLLLRVPSLASVFDWAVWVWFGIWVIAASCLIWLLLSNTVGDPLTKSAVRLTLLGTRDVLSVVVVPLAWCWIAASPAVAMVWVAFLGVLLLLAPSSFRSDWDGLTNIRGG